MFHLYYVIVFSVEIVNLKKLQKSINEMKNEKAVESRYMYLYSLFSAKP